MVVAYILTFLLIYLLPKGDQSPTVLLGQANIFENMRRGGLSYINNIPQQLRV